MAQPISGLRIFVPVSHRLQLVATGVNRLNPFLPLFASSGLHVPPRGLLPTQLGLFYLDSGATIIHLMRISYPVSSICSATCFFVPVNAPPS